MARRSLRLRGRLKSQSLRYIVPFLLIIGLIIALIYGRFDKDDKESGRAPLLQPLHKPPPPPPLEPIPELVPEPHPELSIKLDGLFQDWQNYKVGWPETGKEGGSFEHNIDIKEFYYKTDNNYLYLFFKCVPSILERYQKYGFSGIFAYLYIDSDSNKGTGATKIDHSGNSAMLGTEYRIWVPIWVSGTAEHGGRCGISYEMHKWDSSSKDFSIQIRKENPFLRPNSLIAHGDDGIEIALFLSDIKTSQGQKFDFICLEWANNEPKYANRIQVKIE
jgi:hypothetical protein